MDKILLPRAPEQMDVRTRKFIDICTGVLNALILDGTLIPTGPGDWTILPSALGRAGSAGMQGRPGQDGSRILASIGEPAQSLGTVGDWCFDKSTKDVYRKIELFGMPPLWQRQFSLWGGPPGPRGEKGERGAQGPPGPPGTSGSTSTSAIACHLNLNSTQTFTTGTPSAISFATITRNDGGIWSAGAPTRFTAPSEGWYAGGCYVHWAAQNSNGRRLIARIDGTSTISRASTTAATDHNDPSLCVHWEYYMTAGMYVEYLCDQNAGVDVDIQTGTKGWMFRIN